jgi:hypothetical protein
MTDRICGSLHLLLKLSLRLHGSLSELTRAMPSYVWVHPPGKTHHMTRIVATLVIVGLVALIFVVWRAENNAARSSLPPGEQNCIIESTPDGGKRAMCWDVHPGQRV